jgi:hypothetical protein
MLKDLGTDVETRADILGHRGKSETDERYCARHKLPELLRHLEKLPVATGHLEAQPVRLLPWVADLRKRPRSYRRKPLPQSGQTRSA